MGFTRKRQPISLDIQDDLITYVDVKEPDLHAIHAFGSCELPDGIIDKGKILDKDALANILRNSVRQWKIKHREVRFHVPDPFVFLRKVELPESVSFEEIKGYLYMEVGISIPVPFEDPVFDYVPISESAGEKKEILLFVSPKPLLTDYAEVLQSAGLKPVCADITPLSVYRLLYALGMTEPNDHIMCIQLHQNNAMVSLFHDHQPIFTRQLAFQFFIHENGADISKTTQLQLEETFTELDRIISFYTYSLHQGDVQISMIIIIGDHPFLSDFEQELENLTNVPVKNLKRYKFRASSGEPIPHEFLLPIGLALKGVK